MRFFENLIGLLLKNFNQVIMEAISKLIVLIHIIAGSLTLITGPIAIFANRKNIRLHRIAGKIFFIAMNIVCISAIIGFIKRPDLIFYQFLLGISILVYAGILRGVRAIQMMKGGSIKTLDFVYTVLLGLSSITMLYMSFHSFRKEVIPFGVLFLIFGLGSLDDTWKNYKLFTKPENFDKNHWQWTHIHSMLGAFMASTTAFTVNTASYLPWYIQWFGPTLLLLPLQFYWGKKMKKAQIQVA
jgi:uncharacterized membrane protein